MGGSGLLQGGVKVAGGALQDPNAFVHGFEQDPAKAGLGLAANLLSGFAHNNMQQQLALQNMDMWSDMGQGFLKGGAKVAGGALKDPNAFVHGFEQDPAKAGLGVAADLLSGFTHNNMQQQVML